MVEILIAGVLPLVPLVEKAIEEAAISQAVSLEKSSPTKRVPKKAADNLADASKQILHCYHGTAQFRHVDVVEAPWRGQTQYGAKNSALVRISYVGVTGERHEMMAALMTKEHAARAQVVDDNAHFRTSSSCPLQDWQTTSH